MSNTLRILLSVLVTALAVLASLSALINAAAAQGYMAKPPTGDRAMGLVLLLGLAVVSAVSLLIATAAAGAAGGLAWAGPGSAGRNLLWAIAVFGIAVGPAAAMISWAEWRGPFVAPLCLTIGVVAPLLLAAALVGGVWGSLATAPAVLRTVVAIGLMGLSLVSYATAGYWAAKELRRAADNHRRAVAEDVAREAEWRRKQARTLMQRVQEEFAEMQPGNPLWVFVSYMPEAGDDAVRQVIIARATQVPDFESELIRTTQSPHAVYRHGCLELIRYAPAGMAMPGWHTAVDGAWRQTLHEMADQPDWLTDTAGSNPWPMAHVEALVGAVRRVTPADDVAGRLQPLRDAVSRLKDSPQRQAAMNLLTDQ